MFKRIFVEEAVAEHPRTHNILNSFAHVPVKKIRKIEEVWGRVKKPYLQKRDNLNLFVGNKRGQLVKPAPAAYGMAGEEHYYFVHAYNCPYECQYCYLQGYFNSPDLVLFVNHEDIGREIKRMATPGSWFHAGEYSDSLALSHLSSELPFYFDLFGQLPRAKLELRTKSANIREALKLHPLPNVFIAFSLSVASVARRVELGAAPLKARLLAIKKLHQAGHPVAIHFDPIIHDPHLLSDYNQLFADLSRHIPLEKVAYFSLGVLRFTPEVHKSALGHYPKAAFLRREMVAGFDGKIRLARPLRAQALNQLQKRLVQMGVAGERIYFCMEGDAFGESAKLD